MLQGGLRIQQELVFLQSHSSSPVLVLNKANCMPLTLLPPSTYDPANARHGRLLRANDTPARPANSPARYVRLAIVTAAATFARHQSLIPASNPSHSVTNVSRRLK